jgi:hypothetical protein
VIGREVIPAATEVIRRLGPGLEFHPLNVGAERYLTTGEALPEDNFAQIEAAGAILLGAIGDPRITDRATAGRRWAGSAVNWISTRIRSDHDPPITTTMRSLTSAGTGRHDRVGRSPGCEGCQTPR